MLRMLLGALSAVIFAVFVRGADDYYVMSKRTIASSNGGLDQAFFTTYFGKVDPSSTHSSCLDRWLQMAAPDDIGMHFPSGHETPAVPAGGNGTMTLSDWDTYRISLHNASALSNKKNAFHDFATAFFIPDLGAHAAAFIADGVPFVGRRYTQGDAAMFVAILATPGNGHTLELQAAASLSPHV